MKKFNFLQVILVILIVTFLSILIVILFNYNEYKIDKSIVFIETQKDSSIKNGMGFVYKISDEYAYVITNYHVIEGANSLYVYNELNQKERAEVFKYDSYSDIAILQMDNTFNMKEINVGSNVINENDEVYYYNLNQNIEGATVLSLDNKIELSASYGNSYYNAISVKGNIVSGNSGGPLFNQQNEVIGLISLKDTDSNTAFCILIDDVMKIVTKLENNTLLRPNLGGTFVDSSDVDTLEYYNIHVNNISGVVIVDIIENYPLHLSNMIKGDIITTVNDVVIEDVFDLQREIYSYQIGDTIILGYYRDMMHSEVNIELKQ